ncbi:hypothetical protein TorRG33x02_069040 [Trema orientale]|uniref:Uncharacterized protein n=1 Tax=Trema orientale TaxID=63057 RepID=A0A2P5FHB3_TREOI|nr:hypothetical protein TorRG33x02_069040 [Trema orientale]
MVGYKSDQSSPSFFMDQARLAYLRKMVVQPVSQASLYVGWATQRARTGRPMGWHVIGQDGSAHVGPNLVHHVIFNGSGQFDPWAAISWPNPSHTSWTGWAGPDRLQYQIRPAHLNTITRPVWAGSLA